MTRPPDLPAILNAIREDPDDGDRWFALASWPWDNGRDDEAVVVRVFWPTLRDKRACVSLKATLSEVKRSANWVAKVARKIEGRADDTPRE
jgi:hypothetical protein